jgi:hypothetical protein
MFLTSKTGDNLGTCLADNFRMLNSDEAFFRLSKKLFY